MITKHVPNILTGSRVVLAVFVYNFIATEQFAYALIFHLIIFLTDVADGFLARKFHAESKLGEVYLEHLADVSWIFFTVLGLISLGKIPGWFVYVFIPGAIIFITIKFTVPGEKLARLFKFYIQPFAYGSFIVFMPIYFAFQTLPLLAFLVVLFLMLALAFFERERITYFLSNMGQGLSSKR
jgi:phosphatidylglycerophosphate synthase